MSRDGLQKFVQECEKDDSIRLSLDPFVGDPLEWCKRAQGLGFDLTLEEAHGLIAGAQELGDEDLEDVAGGWSKPPETGGGG